MSTDTVSISSQPPIVHRSFKYLASQFPDRYHNLVSEESHAPPYVQDVSLREGEQVLGVYENLPGSRIDSIVVTDLGLYVARDLSWHYILYQDIERITLPLPVGRTIEERKRAADRIVLILASGQIVEIFVRGGTRDARGRVLSRDVYSFYMFLQKFGR